MPYTADAAYVRTNYLKEIKAGDTTFDAEIDVDRTAVAVDIDLIAKEYTTLPLLNTYVKTALANMEAEWVAARFRKKRPYGGGEGAPQAGFGYKSFEEEAKARIHELFKKFYWGHTGFVGSARSNDATPHDWYLQPT